MIRSAPTESGSSTSSTIGSGERASIPTAVRPVITSAAWARLCVTVGATEAYTTPRTSLGERPAWSRKLASVAAHSSGVRSGLVVSRHRPERISPSK